MDGKNETYECKRKDTCNQKWQTNESYFWSKQNDKISFNTSYLYPVSRDNFLAIPRSDKITEKNVCFSIDYWVTDDKETKINIEYNIEKECVKDTILTIRPKNNEPETTEFCLRDLIALNAENYSISFNVEQHDYNDRVNGFVLRIYDPIIEDGVWEFSKETLTFLDKTENNMGNNWNEEWTKLSPNKNPFDLTEDYVHFSGIRL